MLKDIFDNSYSGNPAKFFLFGEYLYFSATGGTYGNELWRTDGSSAGTLLFKDIHAGIGSSEPSNFFEFNNRLFLLQKHLALDMKCGRQTVQLMEHGWLWTYFPALRMVYRRILQV